MCPRPVGAVKFKHLRLKFHPQAFKPMQAFGRMVNHVVYERRIRFPSAEIIGLLKEEVVGIRDMPTALTFRIDGGVEPSAFQRVAADFVLFFKYQHLGPGIGRFNGRSESGGTGADHDYVRVRRKRRRHGVPESGSGGHRSYPSGEDDQTAMSHSAAFLTEIPKVLKVS